MFRRWRAAESAARSAADPLPMIRTSVSMTGSFDRLNGTSVLGIKESPQRHREHGVHGDGPCELPPYPPGGAGGRPHRDFLGGSLWTPCLCGAFYSFEGWAVAP